jgi:hypothetical protein
VPLDNCNNEQFKIDLFDTSKYRTLEGNSLVSDISSESEQVDSNDFYQSNPPDIFQDYIQTYRSNSVNLYGDELLSTNHFHDSNHDSSFSPNLPAHSMNPIINGPNGPLFSSWKTKNSSSSHSISTQIDSSSGLPRKICSNCGSISTPSWRRCPEGRNLLCNACGLYQKLHNRPRPLRIREDGSVQVIRNLNSQQRNVCRNCKTTETPIWRRSQEDRNYLLCNACALYLKSHNLSRPGSYESK